MQVGASADQASKHACCEHADKFMLIPLRVMKQEASSDHTCKLVLTPLPMLLQPLTLL